VNHEISLKPANTDSLLGTQQKGAPTPNFAYDESYRRQPCTSLHNRPSQLMVRQICRGTVNDNHDTSSRHANRWPDVSPPICSGLTDGRLLPPNKPGSGPADWLEIQSRTIQSAFKNGDAVAKMARLP
jgi:hypothetical protein